MMLFERGPLDPVDVEAATVLSPRTTFAGDAATLASQLGASVGALGSSQGAMASSWAPRMDLGAGSDLAAAADAHDRQARDFDSAIGAVAGNADAHVGEIAGLSNDTAADIAAGEPDFPSYEEHPPNPGWPFGEAPEPTPPEDSPGPGGTVADLITAYYNRYLGRDPGDEGINAWAPLWPDQDAIEHGILFSGEYGDKVNQIYESVLGRGVTGDELDEHHAHKDSLASVRDQVQSRA